MNNLRRNEHTIYGPRKASSIPWVTVLLLSMYEYIIDYARYKLISKHVFFITVFAICVLVALRARKYRIIHSLSCIYLFIVFAMIRMSLSNIDFTYLLHWLCIMIALGIPCFDIQHSKMNRIFIVGGLVISCSCILHMLAPNLLYSIGELFLDSKWKSEAVRFASWLQYTGLTYQTGTSANIAIVGLAAYLSMIAYNKKKKLVVAIVLACFYIGIALTSKRMMFILTFLCPLIMYMCKMFFDKKKASNRFVAFFSIIILSFVGLSIVLPYLGNVNVIRRFFLADLSDSNSFTTGRVDLFRYAIDLFQADPLFGAGWGVYGANMGTGAHNVYLQLLAETGAMGFLLYMTAVIQAFALTLKNMRKSIDGSNITKGLLTFSILIQSIYLLYSFSGNPLYELPMKTVYIYSCAIGVTVGNNSGGLSSLEAV